MMIKKTVPILCVVILLSCFNVVSAESGADDITEYRGMCDASAAVAIDASTFVVASDEDNILRFYHRDGVKHEPTQTFDLGPFLNLDSKHPEADIEAAAQIGNRIYWITSHARNKKSKRRSSRYKFFATQLNGDSDHLEMLFIGRAYASLIEDMITDPSMRRFDLQQASRHAAKRADSLNIEGMSAGPDGTLWIAFRSPVPDGKALLVSLENPQDVISGQSARFGDAILLPLQGLGIRAMAFLDQLNAYIIIAGGSDGRDEFKAFLWSGSGSDDPLMVESLDLRGLHPETVIVYPGAEAKVQLLSDDGMRRVGRARCKHAVVAEQRFRSMWVTLK